MSHHTKRTDFDQLMKNSISIVAIALGLTCAVNVSVAADANVEVQDIGPVSQNPQDVRYVVSPQGGHLAAVAHKGSRMVVIVDGVVGPKFDEIVTPTEPWIDPRGPMAEAQAAGTVAANLYPSVPVVFSKDGKRYAYLGRQGKEWVVIADGKELIRTTVEPNQTAAAGMQFTGEDGKHLLFASSTSNGYELWVDGQKMPGTYNSGAGGSEGTTDPLISPDGSRYAYVAQIGRDKRTVIVDGKDAGFLGDNLAFTADSQHLFALVRQGPVVWLAVDGKPKMKTDGISQVVMAPTGNGFAAVLQRLNPPGQFLVFNGKKIEGSDCPNIVKVVISPDGKHFAALCSPSPSVKYVLWDGKKGQEYFSIDTDTPGLSGGLRFSADSTKLGYVAMLNNKKFIVINDDESDAFDTLANFTFSADGKHVVMTGLQGQSAVIILDGKVTKRPANSMPQIESFSFSPDGSHYAYFCGGGVRDGGAVVIDGQETGLVGTFTFSPDSKHVAVVGHRATDNKRGLFLDGNFVYGSDINNAIRYRAFTPDSQHLCWVAMEAATGANAAPGAFEWVTYEDGNPVARCDRTMAADQIFGGATAQFEKTPRAWSVGKDGELTVIGPVGEGVKRFKAKPAANTNLATMLAAAEVRNKAESSAAAADRAKALKEEYAKKKRLYYLNAERAQKGLPPLDKLPDEPAK